MQADLPVPGQVRAARTNPLLPSIRHTLQTPDTPSALNAEAVWNRKAPEDATPFPFPAPSGALQFHTASLHHDNLIIEGSNRTVFI